MADLVSGNLVGAKHDLSTRLLARPQSIAMKGADFLHSRRGSSDGPAADDDERLYLPRMVVVQVYRSIAARERVDSRQTRGSSTSVSWRGKSGVTWILHLEVTD